MKRLDGKKIAIILDDDFEDSEFDVPYRKLKDEGADITIVGLKKGKELTGKNKKVRTRVDAEFDEVNLEDFDALVIPGGYSPDRLRAYPQAVDFVKRFKDKVIAAICHGPQILITADMVRGRTMTSWKTVAIDLKNAGANYIDKEVVVDGDMITSRQPSDLDAFVGAIIDKLIE
ncbi:MAG TPA: type 1 glutamine amidotransferase [Halobacteria archaeon]|jgi:protease I|nr:type 1 glutamine amidotransferase [Halobacteria archaeon]